MNTSIDENADGERPHVLNENGEVTHWRNFIFMGLNIFQQNSTGVHWRQNVKWSLCPCCTPQSTERQHGLVTLITLWVAAMWDHSICLLLSDCLSVFEQPPPHPPSLASQVNWDIGSVLADIHRHDAGTSAPLPVATLPMSPLVTHCDMTSSSTCRDNCMPIIIVLAEMD